MIRTTARRATARGLTLGVAAGLALPAAVALPASPAAAEVTPAEAANHYDYLSCYASGIYHSTNGPGPLDESRSGGGDTVRARVVPDEQRAGSYARSEYDPDEATTAGTGCYTTAAFENVYTVLPGTSGLRVGQPVTLVAEVDVDAVMDEHTDNSSSYTTDWRLDAYYGVSTPVDCPPPAEDDGDEGEDGGSSCDPQVDLASFSTTEQRRVDGSMPSAYDPDGSWSYQSFFDYEIQDNTGQDASDSKLVDETICSVFPCQIQVDPTKPLPLGPEQPRKDRAVLTFTTEIGQRLDIRGSVNLKTFAGGGEVSAVADAMDGLQATLTPGAGSQGVVLALGEVPVEVEEPDSTAPSVTATTSTPANEAGWHREDVAVELAATDDVAPASISYRLGTGEPVVVQGATASVPVTAEGETTLTYWAADAAGNRSPEQQLVVRLDKTAPTLHVPTPVTMDATTTSGTAWTYAVKATDPAPAGGTTEIPATCTPASGSVFPVGSTTIHCEATDAAGNTGRGTIGVTVRPFTAATPVQRLTALKGAVEAVTAPGVAQPLSAKLDVALTELSRKGKPASACAHLAQFEHMTAQRSGKQLDAATATRLIAESTAVRVALC